MLIGETFLVVDLESLDKKKMKKQFFFLKTRVNLLGTLEGFIINKTCKPAPKMHASIIC